MSWHDRITSRGYVLLFLVLCVLFIGILFFMERVPYCTCGYIKLWHGVVQSSENSQHIADWYTFSHIIHGFIFYAVARMIGKRRGWPVGVWFLAAVSVEMAWEVFENTDFIINRYREATISLQYYGDSIINSVSDVLFMVAGFWAARRLPVWLIVSAAIIMELGVGYAIRDNLTLNIVMLLYPFERIKDWQSGI